MIKAERKNKIISLVNEHEIVSFDTIAGQLAVSSATIRRDVDELAAEGLIEKTRGGIVSLNHGRGMKEEPSLWARGSMNMEEKARMAAAALKYIKEDECIALASGTTVLELAKLLNNELRLSVVTYDLLIGVELSTRQHFDVLMVGGFIKKNYCSTHGFFAQDMMSRIRVDKAFISADAVDLSQGIMGYTEVDIGTKSKLIESANEVFLLCDHSKFNNLAFIKVCDIERVHHIITGKEIDENTLKTLKNMGVDCITV